MEANRRNQSDVIVGDSDRREEFNINNVPASGMHIPGPVRLTGTIRSDSRYPCLNPINPHMRNEEMRLRSFYSHGVSLWRTNTFATERQMAKTGLYYLGERDKVKCFYCNGGLENWEQYDDPWTEHAKWYPQCEFLLRQRGDDFVRNIHQQQNQQQQQQQHQQQLQEQQQLYQQQLEQERLEQQHRLEQQEERRRQQEERRRQQEQREEELRQQEIRDQQEFERMRQQLNQQQQHAQQPQQSRPQTQTSQQGSQQQPATQHFTTTSRNGRQSTFNIYINPPRITRTTTTTTTASRMGNIPTPGPSTARTGATAGTRTTPTTSTRARTGSEPEIVDPGEERQTIAEIVSSALEGSTLAAHARVMGFSNDQIRRAMTRQITEHITNFETAEELVHAIVNNEPQQPATQPTQPSSPPSRNTTATEIGRMRNERLCKICWQRDACIVFIPCGHLISCQACSTSTRRCPVSGCTDPVIAQRIRSYIS